MQGNGASRARILISDDNVDFKESTAEILELAGYQVDQAINREDAARRLNDEHFDLFLLDLGVDRGGLGVLDRAPHLPVVVALSGAEGELEDPRISSFLAKPVSPVRLLAELSRCLGQVE